MSQENIDTQGLENLRRGVDAWNRQDLDAFLETWHPDCEWRPAFPRSLEGVGAVYHGRDGIARAWRGVRAVWKEYRLDVEDARVAGQKIVVVGRVYARGIESGMELDSGWSALIRLRDGMAISAWDWLDRDEALKAVGLSEWAMSRENVEVVEAAFEAWNTGDMDAFRDLFDPDVIWRQPEGWPEPGPEVGREAVMHQLGQQRETWDADALEPTSDFIDAADRIVVRFIWRGAGHGPEANLEATGVFTVRKGRVFYVEFFWDHAEALETLGLSEQAMSQEDVELVRSSIEAYSAGDRDAYLDFFAEDVEVCPDVSRFPEAEPFRGREEFRRFIADIDEGWEGGASAGIIREVFGVGDRVVARADWIGRGRASGIDLRSSLTSISTVRDGRIVKIEYFFDHAQALEAAGLSE